MGTVKVGSMSFVMALLNLRLNYWLPNPDPDHTGAAARLMSQLRLKPGLKYLWSEAVGSVNETRPLVNCSDGGHFENLAVYELIKRQCSTIVCIDGEADPDYLFHGFNTLQRYAEIDFGAKINLELGDLVPQRDGQKDVVHGTSRRQYAVGDITYSDGTHGTFVYFKLAYSGREPQYVQYYRDEHADFPHESTSDQFFNETQFEVYRALGHNIGGEAFADENGDVRRAIKNGTQ